VLVDGRGASPPVTVETRKGSTVAASRSSRPAVAAAVTFAALLVALSGAHRPLAGLDEAASLLAVHRPWRGVLALLNGADAPLVPYYVVAKAWLAACPGLPELTGLRLLSAVAAALTAGLAFLIVTRRGGLRTGVVAAVVLIATPGFSRYAQEARPSAVFSLGVTLSWLLWSARVWPSESRRRRTVAAVAYPLSLAGALLTSLFAVFQWPAQALAGFAVGRRDRRWLGGSALAFGVAAVLAGGPAWLALRNGTGPRAAPAADPATVLGTLARVVEARAGTGLLAGALAVLAVIGFAASLRTGSATDRERAVTAGWWLVLPVALSLAVVVVRPGLLQPRYLHPALVPLSILAADGVVACARRAARAGRSATRAVTALVLLTVIALSIPSQLAVRDPAAHEAAAPALLAAVDAAFAQHPDARLFAGSTSASTLLSALRPELAEQDAARRIDPVGDQVWPRPRPRSVARALLDGTAPVIWVAPRRATSDSPPSRPPAVLLGSGFEIDSVVWAGKWFVVTLSR
jgi:mannosyltransferase